MIGDTCVTTYPVQNEGEKISSFADCTVRPPADGKDDSETSSMSNKERNKMESDENKRASKCLEDGSLTTSSPFSECTTPPCLHWGDGLKTLLNDSEGVKLFRQYLEQEQCADCLNFWLACEGLKKSGNTNGGRKNAELIRIIYGRYLSHPMVPLAVSAETRLCVSNKIRQKDSNLSVDVRIFDGAQGEMENFLSSSLYKNFLQSDVYLQCIQQQQQRRASENESDNDSNHSGQQQQQRQQQQQQQQQLQQQQQQTSSRYLSTVVENEILRDDDALSNNWMPLTHHLRISQRRRVSSSPPYKGKELSYAAQYHDADQRHHRLNKHACYAPCIAVSAQDSELQSLSSDAQTDDAMSLPDGSVDSCPISLKKYNRLIRQRANQNPDRDCNNRMFKGRELKPKDPLLVHTDPNKFAAILIEKLEEVKQQQQSQEKCNQKLEVQYVGDHRQLDGLFKMQVTDEQDDQIILDEHVDRVFNEPIRRWSPPPDRRRSTAPLRAHNIHHRTRCRDPSNLSLDSGTEHDFARSHKGKNSNKTNRMGIEYLDVESPDASGDHWVPKDGRKKETEGSCVDSGVSVSTTITANERVCYWVLNNDKYSNCHTESEKESSGRHRKSAASSYSLLSNSSPTGKSKKSVAYNASRAGCLERNDGCSGARCGSWIQPSQPLAQDPSMPMLPVPNTTTQLEEARRRLEDDAKTRMSRAKHGSSSKDKGLADTKSRTLPLKSSLSPPVDLCLSASATSRKKSTTLSASNSPTTTWAPSGADVTLVKYHFKGEPYPYVIKFHGKNMTLAQFKQLIAKRGKYRYFFKKASDEISTGVVNEEIIDDNEILPLWEGNVYAKVESID